MSREKPLMKHRDTAMHYHVGGDIPFFFFHIVEIEIYSRRTLKIEKARNETTDGW